ncbi:MAG: hypothetical protein OC190_15950 [Novosphingobium aromaticivorans]|jgi:hypothetical protein|nr:hypothetical protein [Novosphingobium aromaticivorans]
MAQAGATSTTFDPLNDMHYAMSEDDQYRLDQIKVGLATIGNLIEELPLEDIPEIDAPSIAALFRVFAYGVEGVLNSAPITGPSKH